MLVPVNISKFDDLSFNKKYVQDKIKYGLFKDSRASNSKLKFNSEIHF